MTIEAPQAHRAVSVLEAAIRLGIGKSLAWELVWSGRLRTVRLGHRRVVPVSAIDEILEAQEDPR